MPYVWYWQPLFIIEMKINFKGLQLPIFFVAVCIFVFTGCKQSVNETQFADMSGLSEEVSVQNLMQDFVDVAIRIDTNRAERLYEFSMQDTLTDAEISEMSDILGFVDLDAFIAFVQNWLDVLLIVNEKYDLQNQESATMDIEIEEMMQYVNLPLVRRSSLSSCQQRCSRVAQDCYDELSGSFYGFIQCYNLHNECLSGC